MSQNTYSETVLFRCMNENFPHQTDDIYLTMCGIEQCAPDKEIMSRARDDYHLHVIMSGEGVLDTGKSRKTLRAGQMFLLKPGEKVAYWPVKENPWAYCWMSFNGTRAGNYMREAGFGSEIYSLDAHVDYSEFYRVCDKVVSTPQFNYAGALRRLGLLLEFIGLCIESAELGRKHSTRREHKALTKKSDYVRYAVEFMQNNYSTINIRDVARYLGIDRSYFSSVFRESLGVSPNEFLFQVRMRQSVYLLQNLEISIQDIAHYVGYDDSLTFSKAFRRFFGVSPKYYRDMPADQRPDLEKIIASRRERSTRE